MQIKSQRQAAKKGSTVWFLCVICAFPFFMLLYEIYYTKYRKWGTQQILLFVVLLKIVDSPYWGFTNNCL